MRRIAVPALLLGLLTMSLGCSHIAGMNDVYHHPDNAMINTGSGNPYHTRTLGPVAHEAPAATQPADKPMEKPMDKPMEKAKDKPMEK